MAAQPDPSDEAELPDPVLIAARERAGRAIRDLGHALIGHQVPVDLINEVTGALTPLVDELSRGEPRERPRVAFATWHHAPIDGEAITTFMDRPFSGAASPWGCDIAACREGDEAVARFTLRSAHEGAPGRSHGGIVAALFDDVMGYVIQIHQIAAFTGELTVRYERGAPLHRELVMRARLANVVGRKVHITADLWDGTDRVASATSTFIAISEEMFTLNAPESPV